MPGKNKLPKENVYLRIPRKKLGVFAVLAILRAIKSELDNPRGAIK